MKKTLLTIAVAMASLGAFAQGKILFANDSLHLVYFTTDTTKLAPGDSGLAGSPMYSGATISGTPSLLADLYAGTDSTALSLVKSTTFGATPGKWSGAQTTLAGGAVLTYFEVFIHDSRIASISGAASSQNEYYGLSPIFSATPSSSAYVNLYNTASPISSTWPYGTYDMTATAGGYGSIPLVANVASVPEPSSFALAGLGAAALVIFRRRK